MLSRIEAPEPSAYGWLRNVWSQSPRRSSKASTTQPQTCDVRDFGGQGVNATSDVTSAPSGQALSNANAAAHIVHARKELEEIGSKAMLRNDFQLMSRPWDGRSASRSEKTSDGPPAPALRDEGFLLHRADILRKNEKQRPSVCHDLPLMSRVTQGPLSSAFTTRVESPWLHRPRLGFIRYAAGCSGRSIADPEPGSRRVAVAVGQG